MITDQDVADLYRCLLNRAPEAPDTVTAFKSYYPDFASGRLAILRSAEFARLRETEHGSIAPRLSHAFLRRAAPPAQPAAAAPHPELRAMMQKVLRAHGNIRLAVIAGDTGMPLADLLPAAAQAAVLHISASAPDRIPQLSTSETGLTLFQVALAPDALAALLDTAETAIDLLAIFGPAQEWFAALRPHLASRAILLADENLPDWLDELPDIERPLQAAHVHMRFRGGWFLPVTYAATAPPSAEPPIPGLCIAAIVRNEQNAAPNMIASAAPVAELFVVIDTGSTDATVDRVETALKSTGKPYVIGTTQPGRFDHMRNTALSLVPAAAQWILMLDADEELCPEDHEALRALLQNPEHDAYALPRYNYTGPDKSGEVAPYPDRQVRLFRHRLDNELRYAGAVHETLQGALVNRLPLDATAIGQGAGGPHIHHLVRRFRTPEEEARKQEFYRGIAAEHSEPPPQQ
jgi:hypothetical protein